MAWLWYCCFWMIGEESCTGFVICVKPEQVVHEKNGEQVPSSSFSWLSISEESSSSLRSSDMQQGTTLQVTLTINNIAAIHFFTGSKINWQCCKMQINVCSNVAFQCFFSNHEATKTRQFTKALYILAPSCLCSSKKLSIVLNSQECDATVA